MSVDTFPSAAPLRDAFDIASRRGFDLVLCSSRLMRETGLLGSTVMTDDVSRQLRRALRTTRPCSTAVLFDFGLVFGVPRILCPIDSSHLADPALLFLRQTAPEAEVVLLRVASVVAAPHVLHRAVTMSLPGETHPIVGDAHVARRRTNSGALLPHVVGEHSIADEHSGVHLHGPTSTVGHEALSTVIEDSQSNVGGDDDPVAESGMSQAVPARDDSSSVTQNQIALSAVAQRERHNTSGSQGSEGDDTDSIQVVEDGGLAIDSGDSTSATAAQQAATPYFGGRTYKLQTRATSDALHGVGSPASSSFGAPAATATTAVASAHTSARSSHDEPPLSSLAAPLLARAAVRELVSDTSNLADAVSAALHAAPHDYSLVVLGAQSDNDSAMEADALYARLDPVLVLCALVRMPVLLVLPRSAHVS